MELAFISPADMMVVMAVALLVFGPKRLPEVGRQIGSFVKEMRKTVSGFTEAVESVHGEFRASALDSDHLNGAGDGAKAGTGRFVDDSELMQRYDQRETPPARGAQAQTESQPSTGLTLSTMPMSPAENGSEPHGTGV